MFRAYQAVANSSGFATVTFSPYVESVEWDVYQISIQTSNQNDACSCEVHHNGYFLCGTNQGFKDSAVGPPDMVVKASDIATIMWFGANPGDQCQAGIWYNENPAGTTISTAH